MYIVMNGKPMKFEGIDQWSEGINNVEMLGNLDV